VNIFLKNLTEKLPYSIGSKFVWVPFQFRLGKQYKIYKKLILQHLNYSEEQKYDFLLDRLRNIYSYSVEHFSFYRELYGQYGFSSLKIIDLKDFEKLPVLNKETFREFTKHVDGYLKLNTGGTSGKPFSFYVDKGAFAREWAHMHYIWQIKNYSPRNIKITFRGKNISENIVYNPVHNEFIVNTYKPVKTIYLDFINLLKKCRVEYIHGYPSAIYNFFKELEQIITLEEKSIITEVIISCLLGSEYPASYMTEYLKKVWGFDYISWYGHSEMCILAYDPINTMDYVPMYTYGFPEEVNGHLIGTSFNNYDMPLIRYDTEDMVETIKDKRGLISSFKIKEGRIGDFILDNSGTRIPLTALIYGRHHRIFEYVDFIQVKQEEKGEVVFFITLLNERFSKKKIIENIDLTNIDIDFQIKFLNKPILSSSGKIKLKL